MDRNIIFPRLIRYLVAVAEHNSFTRAAEALHVSQPTLSQQIKLLEELLDAQLLDRTKRTVRLTDAGEVYLRHARRALGDLDAGKRAIHELKDLTRGSLRLGMTPITEYLAIPLLENFNVRYPGIAISTVELPQHGIETAVAEESIDVGIAFTNMLSTEARSSDIETHVLFVETLNLAVGKDHPYARQQSPVNVHALEQERMALLNTDFALRRHIDVYFLEHGIVPHVAIETNSLSVIIETVRLGRLATVLPDTIACSQCGLYPVMLLPELPHHTITLICRKGAYKSPACMAFAELAAEWCVGRCQAKPRIKLRPCPMAEVCDQDEPG